MTSENEEKQSWYMNANNKSNDHLSNQIIENKLNHTIFKW